MASISITEEHFHQDVCPPPNTFDGSELYDVMEPCEKNHHTSMDDMEIYARRDRKPQYSLSPVSSPEPSEQASLKRTKSAPLCTGRRPEDTVRPMVRATLSCDNLSTQSDYRISSSRLSSHPHHSPRSNHLFDQASPQSSHPILHALPASIPEGPEDRPSVASAIRTAPSRLMSMIKSPRKQSAPTSDGVSHDNFHTLASNARQSVRQFGDSILSAVKGRKENSNILSARLTNLIVTSQAPRIEGSTAGLEDDPSRENNELAGVRSYAPNVADVQAPLDDEEGEVLLSPAMGTDYMNDDTLSGSGSSSGSDDEDAPEEQSRSREEELCDVRPERPLLENQARESLVIPAISSAHGSDTSTVQSEIYIDSGRLAFEVVKSGLVHRLQELGYDFELSDLEVIHQRRAICRARDLRSSHSRDVVLKIFFLIQGKDDWMRSWIDNEVDALQYVATPLEPAEVNEEGTCGHDRNSHAIQLHEVIEYEVPSNPELLLSGGQFICLVFDRGLIDLGDYLDSIHERTSHPEKLLSPLFWLDLARRVARCVLEGLRLCHDRACVHGDIKPHNVLLFRRHDKEDDGKEVWDMDLEDIVFVLIDFELAFVEQRIDDRKIVPVDEVIESGIPRGTEGYFAPEMMCINSQCADAHSDHSHLEDDYDFELSKSSDFWSLGLLTYYILEIGPKVVQCPFDPNYDLPFGMKYTTEGYSFLKYLHQQFMCQYGTLGWNSNPGGQMSSMSCGRQLVRWCLNWNPRNRPRNVDELLQQPFFSMDFEEDPYVFEAMNNSDSFCLLYSLQLQQAEDYWFEMKEELDCAVPPMMETMEPPSPDDDAYSPYPGHEPMLEYNDGMYDHVVAGFALPPAQEGWDALPPHPGYSPFEMDGGMHPELAVFPPGFGFDGAYDPSPMVYDIDRSGASAGTGETTLRSLNALPLPAIHDVDPDTVDLKEPRRMLQFHDDQSQGYVSDAHSDSEWDNDLISMSGGEEFEFPEIMLPDDADHVDVPIADMELADVPFEEIEFGSNLVEETKEDDGQSNAGLIFTPSGLSPSRGSPNALSPVRLSPHLRSPAKSLPRAVFPLTQTAIRRSISAPQLTPNKSLWSEEDSKSEAGSVSNGLYGVEEENEHEYLPPMVFKSQLSAGDSEEFAFSHFVHQPRLIVPEACDLGFDYPSKLPLRPSAPSPLSAHDDALLPALEYVTQSPERATYATVFSVLDGYENTQQVH